jgi:hypothetical protein
MNRRSFLGWGLSTPAAALFAQTGPPRAEPVEAMTPPADTPAIALNHLGFLPGARKTVIYRYAGEGGPADFQIREIGGGSAAVRQTLPLRRETGAVIDCLVGDFSGIDRQGLYQVSIAGELGTPFFIHQRRADSRHAERLRLADYRVLESAQCVLSVGGVGVVADRVSPRSRLAGEGV